MVSAWKKKDNAFKIFKRKFSFWKFSQITDQDPLVK